MDKNVAVSTWEEFNLAFHRSDTTEQERRKIYLTFLLPPWVSQDEKIFQQVLLADQKGKSFDSLELFACCLENYLYQQGGSSHDHLREAMMRMTAIDPLDL